MDDNETSQPEEHIDKSVSEWTTLTSNIRKEKLLILQIISN